MTARRALFVGLGLGVAAAYGLGLWLMRRPEVRVYHARLAGDGYVWERRA